MDNKVTHKVARNVQIRANSLQKARRKMLTSKNEKISRDSVFENMNNTLNQKFDEIMQGKDKEKASPPSSSKRTNRPPLKEAPYIKKTSVQFEADKFIQSTFDDKRIHTTVCSINRDYPSESVAFNENRLPSLKWRFNKGESPRYKAMIIQKQQDLTTPETTPRSKTGAFSSRMGKFSSSNTSSTFRGKFYMTKIVNQYVTC